MRSLQYTMLRIIRPSSVTMLTTAVMAFCFGLTDMQVHSAGSQVHKIPLPHTKRDLIFIYVDINLPWKHNAYSGTFGARMINTKGVQGGSVSVCSVHRVDRGGGVDSLW